MSCLLDDGLECKDVINGLVCNSKSNMSSSSKFPPLKLHEELQMVDRRLEFRKCVAYHDYHVFVTINTRSVKTYAQYQK
jgi:hypothetical protein